MSIHIGTEQRIAAAIMERKGQPGTIFANVQFAEGIALSCKGFVKVDIDEGLGLGAEQVVQMARDIGVAIKEAFLGDSAIEGICNSGNIIVVPQESAAATIARAQRFSMERAA
ncbi:MAG: hypothetical protein EYC62_08605 [Alphaproteobacteria bacterium]|nr:MAG: hypothetical protein EYC62_08605 [Alphaproteobacteria bacterium]